MNKNEGILCVGVVGEGKMGSSVFHYLLDFPLSLRWITSKEADLEKLSKGIRKKLNRAVLAGITNETAIQQKMQEIRLGPDIQFASGCDLIIEAIPEDVSRKQALFHSLSSQVSPGTIIATNSSSILPSRLVMHEMHRPFIIGMHFFYPVIAKQTVELIIPDSVPSETQSAAETFLESVGKRPLIQTEQNAFLLNRLWLDVQNEAFRLVSDGVITHPEMDSLVKERLFAFGVFDFFDNVGIDVMLNSISEYTAGYPNKDHFQPFIRQLQKMVAEGKLGQKSGEGFYSYPPGPVYPPVAGDFSEVGEFIRNTWLSAAKRYTMLSRLPIGEMNEAIKDYFGIEKGPFER